MTDAQRQRLIVALNELDAASTDAAQQDNAMFQSNQALATAEAPFGNSSRITREGERVTREADIVMDQQKATLSAAKSANLAQFDKSTKAHQRLDAAILEYQNAGRDSLITPAIEKV